jgi:ribose transport system substrate-binding protein
VIVTLATGIAAASWAGYATPLTTASAAAPDTTPEPSAAPADTQQCGEDVVYDIEDPDGVFAALPPDVQARYGPWVWPVRATPWETFEGKPPPWRIGFISFPLGVPWQINNLEQIETDFAAAKESGLVEGDLVTYVQPSQATATPEQQIAAIQQMVRDGVDGILLNPLAGPPLAPAIDDAGRAGVPVVMLDNVIDESEYVVNVFSNNNSPAGAGVLGLIQEGNVLIVRGIIGNPVETATQESYLADIAACPGINVVGEVIGSWSNPTAKAATLQWLASHPGTEIDAVLQHGVMSSGIISAFEEAGREVPPISFGGCQGGELSWWLRNPEYRTVGTCFNGAQAGWSLFRLLLRVLDGRQLIVRDIHVPLELVTHENFEVHATPDQPLTWPGEPLGPLDGWASNEFLDAYFKEPGTPGDL